MTISPQSATLLRKNKLFEGLEDQTVETVLSAGHVVKSGAQHLLFLHNDPAETCYLVQSGEVKLFRENKDGEEVILDIATNAQIIGETAIFHDDLHDYSAETLHESELIAFPTKIIKKLVQDNEQFSQNMLRHMAAKGRGKDKEIETRALLEAPQRIGCFLLGIGGGKTEGGVSLTLPYEKAVVAKQLGMRPETFSRALSKLKDDLGLTIKGTEITVPDMSALIKYTCAACSETFPCGRKDN